MQTIKSDTITMTSQWQSLQNARPWPPQQAMSAYPDMSQKKK